MSLCLCIRVLRRDVRLPGHRTKDEFDINQLLLSERTDAVQRKLCKAAKQAEAVGAMLTQVGSHLATHCHSANRTHLQPSSWEVHDRRELPRSFVKG